MEQKHSHSTPMQDSQDYLNPIQIHALANAATNQRDYLFVLTLFYSARRVSEITGDNPKSKGLRPTDIDAENNEIHFFILKKKQPQTRPIPMPKKLVKNLLEYAQNNNIKQDEKLFPFTSRRARQIITRLARRAGLAQTGKRQPHPHTLRHSAAIDLTRKAQSPNDIHQAQYVLAHESLDMVQKYLAYNQKSISELQNRRFALEE